MCSLSLINIDQPVVRIHYSEVCITVPLLKFGYLTSEDVAQLNGLVEVTSSF